MKDKTLKTLLALALSLVMAVSCMTGNASGAGVQEQSEQPQAPEGVSICLKEGWSVYTDKHNIGETEKWYCGFPGEGVPVTLPHTVGNEGYNTVAWFANRFTPELGLEDGQRLMISFQGVQYYAKIWINGIFLGEHEGSFGKFSFDVTDYIKDGEENLLALRLYSTVSGATVRGLSFGQLPMVFEAVQFMQAPVYLSVVPDVAIADAYCAARYETGEVDVQVIVSNPGTQTVGVDISAQVSAADENVVINAAQAVVRAEPGLSKHTVTVPLDDFHAWSPDDPYLYNVGVRVQAEGSDFADYNVVPTGFKDLRIDDDGYFQLNGERFYVKGVLTSTSINIDVNSVNVGDDLERHLRQLDYFKAAGFNLVRFLSTPILPEALDYCDKIGLLVYEETAYSWKSGSEESVELMQREVRQLLERDRSHASFAILGMLNETANAEDDKNSYRMFEAAHGILDVVRAYDEDLLVLLSSGRWDYDATIGSASNPGSSTWDGLMGDEVDGAVTPDDVHKGIGDMHYYPQMPYSWTVREEFAAMGGVRAGVLSEAGVGAQPNIVRTVRITQQETEGRKGGTATIQAQVTALYELYKKYELSTLYSSPEDMLVRTAALQCGQRELYMDFIRSNPLINGYIMTGAGDGGNRGEGIFDTSYDYKVGMFDALTEGWSDVRFCVNINHRLLYNDEELDTDIYISNHGALEYKEYSAIIRITGDQGAVYEKEVAFTPEKTESGDPLYAQQLFCGTIPLDGLEAGDYYLSVRLDGTGVAISKPFTVADRADLRKLDGVVYQLGLNEAGVALLEEHGVTVREFDYQSIVPGCIVVLGGQNVRNRALQALYDSIETDGTQVVGLNYKAFGDWGFVNLPMSNEITLTAAGNWLYHYESLVMATEAMSSLRTGYMDSMLYEDVYPAYYFGSLPDEYEMHIMAMRVGNSPSSSTEPLRTGTQLATFAWGEGYITLNTLPVTECFGTPAADAVTLDILAYAFGLQG